MHISEIKLDHVYMFSESGNEIRVLRVINDGAYKGMLEVERTTSGKTMLVNAVALEEVPAYELD
jgi:hypothetical protein